MKLNSSQTTKSHTRLFHIGLSPRDVLVIESMFRFQPAVSERYVFGAPTPTDPVDLVFVNADDSKALAEWERLRAERPELIAVMVSAHEQRTPGHAWVRRPLDLRNCVDLIEALTTANTPLAAPAQDRASQDTLRILVVDDSFPARQFMKFKLEELGGKGISLTVDFADSGEKAIEAAQTAGYDLVFLDVVMPGLDGYDTCGQLKRIRPTRVAMLTSLTTPVDFQRGREAGCDYYLTKPPNDSDLRTVLSINSFRKLTAIK